MTPLELDAPMAQIIRGILMVGATGIVQVLAQLALVPLHKEFE